MDTMSIDYCNIDMSEIYDLVRVAISHVITHCAVPTFFLIGGYLFFTKLQEWDWGVWKTKMRSRTHTILIPYFVWCSISIADTLLRKVAGCLIKAKPWSGISQWLNENGWLHLYWDSNMWNIDRTNMLGWLVPSSSPCLVPFWFMRDMIIVIVFTPVLFWCIRHLRFAFILLLTFCYILGIWIPISGFSSLATLYFCIGAYLTLTKKDLAISFHKYRYAFYLVALFLFPIMVFYNGHETEIGNLIYPFYIISMVGTVISVATSIVKSGRGRISMSLSNTTFFIFAAHVFLLPYVNKIVHKTTDIMGVYGDLIAYFIIPLLTVAICIVICCLLKKYSPKFAIIIGCR